MQLVLTEDQTLLSRTANDFVAGSSPLARLRKLRDTRDDRGYAPDRFAKMAELGWTAIPFSEQDGGLGMGLYITQQIVEAHGGDILVESSPNEGSIFCVRLPRWREAHAS